MAVDRPPCASPMIKPNVKKPSSRQAAAAAGTDLELDIGGLRILDGLDLAADAKTRVLAHRWKRQSHFGSKARAATVRGFLWWCLGFALLVANWIWLQVFVLVYMKAATTPSRISVGVLIFNGSEALFAKAVKAVMRSAELQRT